MKQAQINTALRPIFLHMTKQPLQFNSYTQSLIKSKKVLKKESKILNPEKMEANGTNQTDY